MNPLIWIRGGGDLATGVALRLRRAEYAVVISEISTPSCVRLGASFALAAYEGEAQVEGIRGRKVSSIEEIKPVLAGDDIPICVGAGDETMISLAPVAIVDARMQKKDQPSPPENWPPLIGLGPGFLAKFNCWAAVETLRGHHLGRVFYRGKTATKEDQPGEIGGFRGGRVLRAPIGGHFRAERQIGDSIKKHSRIGTIGTREVVAPIDGVLRGLVHPSCPLHPDQKIGDIDPRGVVDYCFTVSDKARGVGGGVLEALCRGEREW